MPPQAAPWLLTRPALTLGSSRPPPAASACPLPAAVTHVPIEALALLRCNPPAPAHASGAGERPVLLQPLHQTVRHAQRQLRAYPEAAAEGQEGSSSKASPPMATTIELKVSLGGPPASSAPPPAGRPAAPGGGDGGGGGGGGGGSGSQSAGRSVASPLVAGGMRAAAPSNPFVSSLPLPVPPLVGPASCVAAPPSLAGQQQLGSVAGTAPLSSLLAAVSAPAPAPALQPDPSTSPRTSALLASLRSLASLNSLGSLPSSAARSEPSSSLSGLLSALLEQLSGGAANQAGAAAAVVPRAQPQAQ